MDTKTEFASVFIQNQPFLVEIAQYNPPKVCALHQQKVTNLCLLTRAKQTRVGKISITIPVALAGVSGISSVSGTPGNAAKPLRHLRSRSMPPLLVGEALAFRRVFQQNQISFIENETSLPRAPLPGELASGCETERLDKGRLSSERNNAGAALYNLSVIFASLDATSPSRGGFGIP